LGTVNYDQWSDWNEPFDSAVFIPRIYQTAGMFRGMQYLPLVSAKLADGKKDIPKAMFYSMATLFPLAIAVIFTACSQYPGTAVLADSSFPLSYGFSKIFNLTTKQALWLSFPALFGNFYGFVWASGRQLSSMAKSGLLPEVVGWMTETTDTPYVALLIGMTLSFVLALICYYNVFYISFKVDIQHMYMLSSYVIYVFMFVSYIIFKQKYSSLTRSFHSPLGIYGAVVGLFVFGTNTVCFAIFIKEQQLPVIVMVVATILMAIYYFFVLDGKQQFSEEEKEKLFKAYLINGK